MRPPGRLQSRQVWLTATAAGSVLTGHALDGFGLLPGVHESDAVRAGVLAPKYQVVTAVGAALLALVVDRLLHNRRPVLALLGLCAGQLALLGAPELLGRQGAGEGEQWGAVSVAIGLQVLLATAAVVVALLIDALLHRALRDPVLFALPAFPTLRTPTAELAVGRAPLATRMRGPPVRVIP